MFDIYNQIPKSAVTTPIEGKSLQLEPWMVIPLSKIFGNSFHIKINLKLFKDLENTRLQIMHNMSQRFRIYIKIITN